MAQITNILCNKYFSLSFNSYYISIKKMTTVIINKHLCLHISKYLKFLSSEVEICMRECEPMKHYI